MTQKRAETSLQLEEILGELRAIAERAVELESEGGEPIEFDRLAAGVAGELKLQFRHYISFLDELECLEFDPDREEIRLGEAIDEPIESPPSWRDEVEFEFEDVVQNRTPERNGRRRTSARPDRDADEESAEAIELGDGEDSIVELEEVEESPPPDPPARPPGGAASDAGVDRAERAGASKSKATNRSATADADVASPEPDDAPEETPSSNRTQRRATDESNHSSAETSSMNDRKRRKSRSERTSRSSTSDRYERLDEIGTGGLGTVYRAKHKPLDREVAIKEISNVFDVFADIQRDDIVDRFREITQSQAQISHPAIAQIYDVDTNREYPYVVSEYAPNASLRRLIDDDERRTLRIALKYFIQILHGLNSAHEHGLVHGNIKPENVLLDAAGNAKLSDFGLSTLVDLEGASDQVYVGVGAVAYMAPEQFQNPNAATTESDIYSLGIMFYEMLTGKVPGRRSPMPSSFYPEIPRKLDDIFDRMSMDGAEDRYSSIEEILRDFYGAEEIINLLDRQSGVVYLRDPLEYGDMPLVDEDGEIKPPEDVDTTTPAASVHSEEPPDEEIEAEDGREEAAEENTEENSEDAAEAEGEEDDSEEQSEEDDSGGDDDQEEAEAEQAEEEDDEVLDKLDEYGEMFDEEDEEQ